MARGGRRSGKPGGQYSNRTDLQTGPRAQPVQAAPGQPYGERGRQEAAQQVVPLPAGGPTAQPIDQLLAPAGGLGAFNGPSDRPNEPLTAGLDQNYTPETPAPDALSRGAAALNTFAQSDNASPELRELAEIANAMLMNRAASG